MGNHLLTDTVIKKKYKLHLSSQQQHLSTNDSCWWRRQM